MFARQAADTALEMVRELGIAAEDISLLRFDAIGPCVGLGGDGRARLGRPARTGAAQRADRRALSRVHGGRRGDRVVRGDRTGPDPDHRRDGGGPRPAADHRDLHGPGPAPAASDPPRAGLAAGGARRGVHLRRGGHRVPRSVRPAAADFDVHQVGLTSQQQRRAQRRSSSRSRRAWRGCSRSRRGRAWVSAWRSP